MGVDLAAKKEAASPKKSMRLHATLFCSNQDAKGCFPIYQYTALIVTGVYNISDSEVKCFRAVFC